MRPWRRISCRREKLNPTLSLRLRFESLELRLALSSIGHAIVSDEAGNHVVDWSRMETDAPQPSFDQLGQGAESFAANWISLGPFGGDVADVAASPTDSSLILAGIAPNGAGAGGGLVRSIDGGTTWTEVPEFRDLTSVYDIEFAADGTIFVASFDSVWKSVNGGQTWTQLDLGLGISDMVFTVAVDPHDNQKVWAAPPPKTIMVDDTPTVAGLLLSVDGGQNWQNVTPPDADGLARAVVFDPLDALTVYVGYGDAFVGVGQFWVTEDYGLSWENRSTGLPSAAPIKDVVHDGSRLLVAGGDVFGSQGFGLFESADGGMTWTPLHDASWPNLAINSVTVDPNDSDVIIVASSGDGVFQSTDGGETWRFGVGNTSRLSLNSIRFAPGESSRIFVGVESLAVLRSTDGGSDFSQSSNGISFIDVRSVAANPLDGNELAIAFSALNSGGVYTSMDGGGTWHREATPTKRWNTVQFATDGTLYGIMDGIPEGVYRRDSGGSWTGLGPDTGPSYETELQTLEFSEHDPNFILAGGRDAFLYGFENAIWRSQNAGATWTRVHEGLANENAVTDFAIIDDGSERVILAAFGQAATTNVGGVLRSDDDGTTWELSTDGLSADVQVSALSISNATPSLILLADAGSGGIGKGGVYRSSDGATQWTPGGFQGDRVYDIVVDPLDDQVVYAMLVVRDKVLRSENGGQTFEPFNNGLENVRAARDLTYVPRPSPRLLLATRNGVYTTDVPVAPRITAVKVGSPDWSTRFKSAVDPGVDFGYPIPHGPSQLTPVSWRNIRQIFVEFSEDVASVDQAEFGLHGSTGGDLSSNIQSITYDAASKRATINLVNALGIDYHFLVVRDTITTENTSLRLDGEWTNGVTSGSSGNNRSGGEFRFGFRVLPGDINQSGGVSVDDAAGIRIGLGRVAGQIDYSIFADLNGSGVIAVNDLGPLRSNLGQDAPSAPPSVPKTVAALPVTVKPAHHDVDSFMAATTGVEFTSATMACSLEEIAAYIDELWSDEVRVRTLATDSWI